MAITTNNNIARAINLASKGYDKENEHLFFQKVIKFLNKRRLLRQAPDILQKLERIRNNEDGIIAAEIKSPKKLDESIKKSLTDILAKHYSAKSVNFTEKLDEKLLDGWKIEINDEIIDLSMRNRINKLKEHLIKNV